MKILTFENIVNEATHFIAAKQYDQLFYMLQCVKLLPQVLNTYAFTAEEELEAQRELKEFFETMNIIARMQAQQGPPSASTSSSPLTNPEPKNEDPSLTNGKVKSRQAPHPILIESLNLDRPPRSIAHAYLRPHPLRHKETPKKASP